MRQYSTSTPFAQLTAVSGGLRFDSSYDPGLISELKRRVPPTARKWEPAGRYWLVAPNYGDTCAQLAEAFLGVKISAPATQSSPAVETRLLRVEYIGRTKCREGGEASAFGWSDGSWCLIFPESALREWFDAGPQRPDEKPTLYAVLLVKPAATLDEIRSAYRRLALQWHPDRCHEPDAAEQFKIISHAYQVLFDAKMRRKYDAGLTLQAQMAAQQPTRAAALGYQPWETTYSTNGSVQYRSPLRCGWVMAEGVQQVARFVVSRILAWEDIIENGKTMISSWPMGNDKPKIIWQ